MQYSTRRTAQRHRNRRNEQVQTLRNAGDDTLKGRCELAGTLTYQRGDTQRLREQFLQVQSLVEAIDRATGEQALEPSPWRQGPA
jgi:hypothetical protein